MINLLKLHLFLFVAGFLSTVTFFTVYVTRYTDATYNEVGTLMFFCSMADAFSKPLFCSIADRHRSYRCCLLASLGILFTCTIPFAIIPFRPQLFFQLPWLRSSWYFMAGIYLLYFVALGVVITLNDVYIVDRCSKSTTGEYLGQYRFMGSLGGLFSMFTVAVLEQFTHLPYLALPMIMCSCILLIDMIVVWNLKNICSLVSTTKDAIANVEQTVAPSLGEKTLPITKENENLSRITIDFSKQALDNTRTSETSDPIKSREDTKRISFGVQLELIYRISRYDNYSLFKYLVALLFVGSFTQIHNVFFLESLAGILEGSGLSSQVSTLNAVNQVASQTGEIFSLLCYSHLVMSIFGRDGTFLFWIFMSGVRYTINGFFIGNVSHWVVSGLEFQTGLLWGLLYMMMVGTPASYLNLLDGLLLPSKDQEKHDIDKSCQLKRYLNELRKTQTDEAIRFAVKATMQSLFSGSCEGIGFALGPLVAGIWLNKLGNSIPLLFQNLGLTHAVVLTSFLIIEFVLIRSIFGVKTKTTHATKKAQT